MKPKQKTMGEVAYLAYNHGVDNWTNETRVFRRHFDHLAKVVIEEYERRENLPSLKVKAIMNRFDALTEAVKGPKVKDSGLWDMSGNKVKNSDHKEVK